MIRTPLMQHQKQMIKFAEDKNYFAWFAAYGVGKTLTALSYINEKQFNRVLVISTKTAIVSTWVDEIRKHTDFRCVMLLGTKQQKLAALAKGMQMSQMDAGYYHAGGRYTTCFLLNLDGTHSIYENLLKWGKNAEGKWVPTGSYFDYVVVDESTKIKSPYARRTKVLWSLGKYIPFRTIMTGFPVTENISDMFAQIRFLDQGETFGLKYWDFMEKYFVKSGFDWVPKKNSQKKILEQIKPFSIHITNDMLDLPPKVYKVQSIEPTKQQIDILRELNDLFRLEFGKVYVDTEFIFAVLSRCLQVCDGFIQDSPIKDAQGNIIWQGGNVENIATNKDEALLDLLDEINIWENKVVIWFKFTHSLKKIAYLLKKAGIPVLTIFGETTSVNWAVNSFQQTSKYNVILATEKKASESITLTEARYSIYYSNDWSADLRNNSEARIRRKGSEKWKGQSIVYTDFVTRGTVEEHVLASLKEKSDLINRLKSDFLAMQDFK